jgi:anaerobic carbon-monoxide dehydrogenase iron sulfur subunit
LNCRHCDIAPCEAICPRQAIGHTEEPYGVAIDSEKCIGCRACLLVCPFGAIAFDSVEKKMVKCDLCQGDPVCVKFCAYDAIKYIDSEELHHNRQFSAAAKLFELQFCADRPGPADSDGQETT